MQPISLDHMKSNSARNQSCEIGQHPLMGESEISNPTGPPSIDTLDWEGSGQNSDLATVVVEEG